MYTYNCNNLQWSQSQSTGRYSIVGYNIEPISALGSNLLSYVNHRSSGFPSIGGIACNNAPMGTSWSNLVYKVGESLDVTQVARVECRRQLANLSFTLVNNIPQPTLLRCPCTGIIICSPCLHILLWYTCIPFCMCVSLLIYKCTYVWSQIVSASSSHVMHDFLAGQADLDNRYRRINLTQVARNPRAYSRFTDCYIQTNAPPRWPWVCCYG